MSDRKEKTSVLEKICSFIVDKRKAVYLIFLLLVIFSIISTSWVKVNNTITDYLADETETRRGLTLMDEEFITYATAQIMVDNITYERAETLCENIENVEGVKEVTFDDSTKHYVNGSALYSVTFNKPSSDSACEESLNRVCESLSDYDIYVSAELGDSRANDLAKEMHLIMAIACVIILGVLLLSSHTYMEVPVLILTFGVAAIINKGSNFIFGTISFISNSIAVVLQLALAIDYAIILCHRYTEERETKEAREAVIAALQKSIPEISGSCLTTLSGIGAMGFMQFKIGFDMSLVLIKAILISILTVFILMPGLLMSFSPLIDKTHHKSFVPEIPVWGNIVIKTRKFVPIIFAGITVIAFFLSSHCPYAYSYANLTTIKQTESQVAKEMINETFSPTNTLAIVVPSGSYTKEQALQKDMEALPQVDTVTGLASVNALDSYSVGDALTPREFSELTEMDIETVRLLYVAYATDHEDYGHVIGGIDNYKIALIDTLEFVYDMIADGYISPDKEIRDKVDDLHEALTDGKEQLESEKYTRLVLNLNISEESEEMYALLDTIRDGAKKYYGNHVLLVGNATSNYDLSVAFARDNLLISILSILFVLIVLFFTFQSAGLPFILILVIQGSIWMNFSSPTILQKPIFFMGYLVVSAIQMGANIDYAIVITNRYMGLRKKTDKFSAVRSSLNLAFPTIFTSGTIMASAGFAIGLLSSDPAISTIGISLGRGTVISILLVMLVLPQLLILGDFIIEKTSFRFEDIREGVKNRLGEEGAKDEK